MPERTLDEIWREIFGDLIPAQEQDEAGGASAENASTPTAPAD